jgi:hypothetical protein
MKERKKEKKKKGKKDDIFAWSIGMAAPRH